MPDVFTKAKRSEVMARIRGRGNKETEVALAKLLRRNGITGWRRQLSLRFTRRESQVTLRPDFVFHRKRLAVFVDGCFWHGCPKHSNMPVNNRAFWKKKFSANKTRDRIVNFTLRRGGWRVLRIWEHELTKNPVQCLVRIQRALQTHF